MRAAVLVQALLAVQIHARLFHWKTSKYSWHKISGELYEKLDPLIDRLVESCQGLSNAKLRLSVDVPGALTKRQLVELLERTRAGCRGQGFEPELDNICQEILEAIDRTLYLFALK